ncbi:acyltransferase family protein [Rhizobium leucaenae]|uniref:Peptidoglycan/LPS O-acetylase OafA/YrhL n=1 Tax=Rhizobium leucaenae TaxID=29450 RepID=A0A7W7EMH4_9HYPH|nr:acyltransferase [Rhizobium leucaenae]MBB4569283.1 peptidoglycan/LPS O-acetylase OafA/YrhL [Rhizobium leucaenae]MBB6302735.1 peptidoglycan/LPS O-acetylase OafA/YrhL [Rhizobium leucaenae]
MANIRDRQLDGLRTVAVSMVLYAHFFAADRSIWGHLGVRLFFVLSGFLITRLLLQARADARYQPVTAFKAFYIRRVLRIFPPYFAMLAFVYFLDLEGARGNVKWHALYLSNYWYALRGEWTPWVLCHTWSLSIEEQFYIAWPLVILLAPRRLTERICIAVIACSLAYRLCWPLTWTPSLMRDLLPSASMDALAGGALLAAYRERTQGWPQWMRQSWMPLAAAAAVALWLRPDPITPTLDWVIWIGSEVFPLVPLVMLVGCGASGFRSLFGRLLESPPIAATGRISYGIYLFHPIVLSLIVKAQTWIPVNVSEQGLGRLIVGSVATLMLASISWLVFEKPLNNLKRYFPYAARGHQPAVPSIAIASEPGEHGHGSKAYNTALSHRNEGIRGGAVQTSDLQ